LKQLMGAVTAVALLLGLYYWTTTVVVCAVPVGTAATGGHFTFFLPPSYFPLTENDIRPRSIARLSGMSFASRSDVVASLYVVRNQKATKINTVWVRASSRIIFALGDLDTRDGRVTLLGSTGGEMDGWEICGPKSGELYRHKVKSTAHTLLTGRVARGEARVVYVEGALQPSVKSGMSIEDFADRNPGSYLAVTMRLE
jgi:hypothetical protein